MIGTLRWGILGAAKFAREHMGPAIHAARGAELVAVASRSPQKVAPFQEFAPGCRAESSYDELLAASDIDAVYIPLPHHLHAEWTLKALAAGKHVLTEKPIGMTVEEVDQIIAARDASGLLAAEAYMIVHHPQWQRARQLVADGGIGEVRHITGAFTYDNSADPGNIRNQPEAGGGLRDIGVYIFGSARFVMGADPTVEHARVRFENGYDTFADIQARFADGPTYSAYVSTRMHLHQAMEFHGTEGLMRLTAPFNPQNFGEARIEIHQPGQGLRVERFPAAQQYKTQVEAFCASIRSGEPYPCPLEFSRGTQQMIDEVLAIATPLDG
ncbi:Gfo/Idh/MocA family protein [Shimia ponticola]|uniref:Gfo/Idh/MocA family protein n=1 Tax=Shimia ponticola TaxID=2582893 RepID=UPI0011BD51CB|nr:Gfo/Idh/MocA family oxidoreductase [Shimia ponticola]